MPCHSHLRSAAYWALAVLALAACGTPSGVHAGLWGQPVDDAASVWDNLIASSSWRAEEPPLAPQAEPTTERPGPYATLECNYSDWRPLASPWPERLQDRVDSQPPRPFRPSQPLDVRPAPTPAPTPAPAAAPVRAPPCYAAIQLPRPAGPAAAPPLHLLYSPDPLPPQALDAAAGLSRCLWTLVAPPGYNVSAAVSMGAWGRGGTGVVHLYAQTAAGELSPVLSLHAPAQASAEVRTGSSVAVLSTALPASATFTLRVSLSLASAAWSSSAGAALLADTLQPPAPTRPWGRPPWSPGRPYPASQGHVDVEAVDLTQQPPQQQQTANCVVAGQAQQEAADDGTAATAPSPPPAANATADEPSPLPASKPSAATSKPSKTTTTSTTSRPLSTAKPGATPARDKASTPAPATPTPAAAAPGAAATQAPTATKKPGR